jgi:integrase
MPELRQLVSHVREPYRAAVWLLVLTGMRPSELAGLRVRDLDLPRRRVTVSGSLVSVEAHGDVPADLSEGPPKTAAGHRSVPIPARLCDMLCETLAARAESRLPLGPEERVFVGLSGRPLDTKWFRQGVMVPALRAAGLPERIRKYDLRHSHASLLIDQGANVVAVAQRLGHSDPAMTLRVYAHLFEGVQEQLTDALDALVRATEEPGSAVVPLEGRRAVGERSFTASEGTKGHRRARNPGPRRSLGVTHGQPERALNCGDVL